MEIEYDENESKLIYYYQKQAETIKANAKQTLEVEYTHLL